MSNILKSAEEAAKKKADEAKAKVTAQAQQAASNFSDPLITATQSVADMAAQKLAQQQSGQIQEQIDKIRNQDAESTCKNAAKLESQLKDNVKEITLFPEKIPMNLTENLATKVGKVANLNKSEMTIPAQKGKFANTAFLGRSIDATGTEDTYGIKDSKVKNKSSSSELTVAAVAIKKYILGDGPLKDDLPAIVKTSPTSFSLTPSVIADRLKTALGGSTTALTKLGNTLLQGPMTGSLDGAAAALMSQFSITLNGAAATSFQTNDISSLQGLIEGINSFTKNSSFAKYVDVGIQSQLLAGLFSEAVALKMPGVVEALVTAGGTHTNPAVSAALRSTLGTTLESGDVDTIEALTANMSVNQILAMEPMAAAKILENYQIPGYTPQYGLELKANALIALLDRIDPRWDTMDRNGEAVSNLFAMHAMSDDARRVLATLPEYRDLITVASFYAPESYAKSMTDKYPMCPILQ